MGTDSADAVDGDTTAPRAYISPLADFVALLLLGAVVAFAGVALLLP